MNKIFEAIDAINWEILEHAYGSAADVPQDLKHLFGADEEAAKNAIYTFWGNIYHQGTIYEATSYATPFIIEALNYCPKSIKSSLIVLLAHIANGMSYNIQHQNLWEEGGTFDDGRTKTAAYKEETNRQLHWVERGILAVWSGWENYLQLLEDENEEVRSEISLLVVSLATSTYKPDNVSNNLSELLFDKFQEKLSTEKNDNVKVSYLNGIANLETDKAKKIALFKYYIGEDAEILKITAAYYLLYEELNQEAIEILNDALYHSEKTDLLFSDSTWFQMKMSFYILNSLCALSFDYFNQIWKSLDKTIRNSFKFGAEYTVSPIIKMVFRGEPIKTIAPNFTDEQRKVLIAILETDNLWIESDGNTSSEFRNWGLERNRTLLEETLER